MRRSLPIVLAATLAGCGGSSAPERAVEVPPPPAINTAETGKATRPAQPDGSVLRFEMRRLDGRREDLARYRGKVVLIVNTATECGFTPQFEGLQSLYEDRRRDGLVVLGFPSNDFAGQEPRSDEEIGEFCRANYGVSFPMFGRTTVTGDGAVPLFRELGEPEWNFNKYLLDRGGRLQERWGAGTTPDDAQLVQRIDALL